VKVHYTPKIVVPNIEILHLGFEYMGTNWKYISKLKLHVEFCNEFCFVVNDIDIE